MIAYEDPDKRPLNNSFTVKWENKPGQAQDPATATPEQRESSIENINAFHHSINMIAQAERMEGAIVRMEIEQQQTQSRTAVLEKQVAELLGKLKDTKGKDSHEVKKVANG